MRHRVEGKASKSKCKQISEPDFQPFRKFNKRRTWEFQ
uniref:Uncharacterized protein n=1 Tax=Rhizophora mucronata TaxID=61149 RepID=A0A2P2Q9H9_RHIMU